MNERCRSHLQTLDRSLGWLPESVPVLERWARGLRETWRAGGRLLVAGNGGSAALAEHLTAEFVGRYQGEHEPWSAIPLTVDPATVTAVANDYGYERVFARQVEAHGRPGDVLLMFSTSGRSPNLLEAACAARRREVAVWSVVGDTDAPLAHVADETICVPGTPPVVQEVQQVIVHLLCELVEAAA